MFVNHEIVPSVPSRGDTLTIGLVTDTHYWPGGGDFYGGDGSLQLLGQSDTVVETLIAELNRANLDLTVHLGDITCGGGTYPMTEAEFCAVQDVMFDRFQRLQAPIYTLPGNHDCPPGGAPWSYFEKKWGLEAGIGRTIDTPFARLVLLNAQGHSEEQMAAARPDDPVFGWVSEGELARLDEALASADDRPVILFLHQLLQPWSGNREFVHYYPVNNAETVLDLMARHGNVRAVFQGHAHRLDVQQIPVGGRPCWFVVSPALIQYPVAWFELTLSAKALRVQLRSLPLPELVERARVSGDGQDWRTGKPEWHDFTVGLG